MRKIMMKLSNEGKRFIVKNEDGSEQEIRFII